MGIGDGRVRPAGCEQSLRRAGHGRLVTRSSRASARLSGRPCRGTARAHKLEHSSESRLAVQLTYGDRFSTRMVRPAAAVAAVCARDRLAAREPAVAEWRRAVRAASRVLLTTARRCQREWTTSSPRAARATRPARVITRPSTTEAHARRHDNNVKEREKKAYQHSNKRLSSDPNPPARLLRARSSSRASSSSSSDERGRARAGQA
jgi:hypothetical protein